MIKQMCNRNTQGRRGKPDVENYLHFREPKWLKGLHEALGGPFWDMEVIEERIPNMTLNVQHR